MAITLKTNSASGDASENPTGIGSESAGAPAMTQSDIAAMAMGRRGAMPVQSTGSYTWAAVIGLICVLLLGALILIQVMENSYYQGAIPVRPYVATRSTR